MFSRRVVKSRRRSLEGEPVRDRGCGIRRKLVGRVIGCRSLAGGLLAITLVPALACRPIGDLDGAPRPSTYEPTARLIGVVFDGYSQDARDVEVRASEARVDLQGGDIELEQVEIAFQEAREGSIQVRADRGRVSLDRDEFVLHGRVSGTTGRGEKFYTDELRFQQDPRRLWTDTPVRVDRTSLSLSSDGMELDLATRRLRFVGRVRAMTRSR